MIASLNKASWINANGEVVYSRSFGQGGSLTATTKKEETNECNGFFCGQDLRLVLKSMATASFGRGPCLRVDPSRVSAELIPPAYVSVRWHPMCTIGLLFGEQIERDKPE